MVNGEYPNPNHKLVVVSRYLLLLINTYQLKAVKRRKSN